MLVCSFALLQAPAHDVSNRCQKLSCHQFVVDQYLWCGAGVRRTHSTDSGLLRFMSAPHPPVPPQQPASQLAIADAARRQSLIALSESPGLAVMPGASIYTLDASNDVSLDDPLFADRCGNQRGLFHDSHCRSRNPYRRCAYTCCCTSQVTTCVPWPGLLTSSQSAAMKSMNIHLLCNIRHSPLLFNSVRSL